MIRSFKEEDLESVNNLLSLLNYKLTKESFKNDFLKVIVYRDDLIKGVLIYEDLIDKLIVDYIVVDEKYRNKGIATKLILEIEKIHNNIENITLEVKKSNCVAINFYRKNGFKEVAIRKKYYGNEDGILMIKEYR